MWSALLILGGVLIIVILHYAFWISGTPFYSLILFGEKLLRLVN